MREAKLCYVDAPWAYFTTRNLAEQWGDDWDDAPYEHNAGEPYSFHDYDKAEGRDPWHIVRVAYSGDLSAPCDGHTNSPYCVRDINAGAHAWLRTPSYIKGTPTIIPAGTTLADFCELVRIAGGEVFLSSTPVSP